jgi:hypothetical protein
VALAGRAGEQRAPAAAGVPAAGQAVQPAGDERRGEVLLADGDLAALPAVSEVAQHGEHGVAQDAVQRVARDEPVEGALRVVAREVRERLAQPGGQLLEPVPARRARDRVVAQPRGHGRREPALDVGEHAPQPGLVGRVVEPLPGRRAARARDAVAPLPDPQRRRGDPQPPAQLTDPDSGSPVTGRCRHFVHVRTLTLQVDP